MTDSRNLIIQELILSLNLIGNMKIEYTHDSKTIPVPSNHKILRYHVYDWVDDNEHIHLTYEPVYERIRNLQTVYWYKNQRVFLMNDSLEVCDIEGNIFKISNVFDLDYINSNDQNMFHVLLEENGYKIVKGELVSTRYYFPLYTIDYGFIVCQGVYNDQNYKRFKEWGEAFDCKLDCINWCNHLNTTMRRNYPEIVE